MSKKLSVITVVYNGEIFLESAIKSVVDQKKEDVEYIIVDGASIDSTMQIVEKYKNYIDVIISEPDNGIYDAMNKGVEKASGEYVVFLNSDDYYDDGVLQSCLNAISLKPDAVIMNTIIEDGEGVKKVFKRINDKNKYKLYIRIPFMHPSVVVKKEVFNQIGGFDLAFKIASDCDFLLKMLGKVDTISYIDEGVVMRAGGISDTCFKDGRKEYKEIYSKYSGNILGAWIGYIESMSFYYLHKFLKVFK